MRRHLSKEDPPEEEDKEEGDYDNGGILTNQEIEVDLSRGLSVSLGGFLQEELMSLILSRESPL